MKYTELIKTFKLIKEFVYIPIYPNSKNPLCVGWQNTKHTDFTSFKRCEQCHRGFNIGIMTGKASGIIVVDIDLKDDGLKVWIKMIQENGEPKTAKQKSPSGGLHYFFKYQEGIKNSIKTNNVGIDVFTDSKFIMTAPSTIGEKKYEWEHSPNDCVMINIPEWLLNWIVAGQTKVQKKAKIPQPKLKIKIEETISDEEYDERDKENDDKLIDGENDNLIYFIEDYKLAKYLSYLPLEYYKDFTKWLTITTCMKSIGKRHIWEDWCKKGHGYKADENEYYWNYVKANMLNINYLINIIKQETKKKVNYIEPTISYPKDLMFPSQVILRSRQLTKDSEQKPKYLNLRLLHPCFDETLESNPMLLKMKKMRNMNKMKKFTIIKSDTNTGKTTSVADYVSEYLKEYRIISIISRVTLANSQILAFRKKGIELLSYQSTDDFMFKNIVCQLDSILKIESSNLDYSDCIVFMDEINSIVKYLTDSSTLDKKRIAIYTKLCSILQTCKMVLATDADVSELVLQFFKIIDPTTENTSLFLNPFQNYSNLNAYQYSDVDYIIGEMIKQMESNNFFLACFDSLTEMNLKITSINKLTNDKFKNNMMVYSSEDGDIIQDPTVEWQKKFVFYTPKIIYGVDFVPVEPQDVFIIATGRTIDPLQIAQQMTRTRKIRSVHYSMNVPQYPLMFKSIEDVSKYYKTYKDENVAYLQQYGGIVLTKMDYDVNENDFLNLFYLSKFHENIFFSNFVYHFQEILKSKGFTINYVIEGETLNIDKKEIIKKMTEETEAKVKAYIEGKLKNDSFIQKMDRRLNVLNVQKEELQKFADYIVPDPKFEQYLSFLMAIKTKGELSKLQKEQFKEDFAIKTFGSVKSYLLILQDLQEIIEIDLFVVDEEKLQSKEIIDYSSPNRDLLVTNWMKKLDTIKNKDTFIQSISTEGLLYGKILQEYESLIGDVIQIKVKSSASKGKRTKTFTVSFNDDLFELYAELMEHRKIDTTTIRPSVLEQFQSCNIVVKEKSYETYMFSELPKTVILYKEFQEK